MCDCGDGPEAFWEETRKARKRHKCSECRGWIEPGEAYKHIRGIWDGEASSFKQCTDCLDLIAYAEECSECICLRFGQTHSDILDDAHDSGIAEYKAGARERINTIRAKRRDPKPAELQTSDEAARNNEHR